VGGPQISGVGFAAGDAVLEELLRKYQKVPSLSSCPTKILVTVFSEEFYRESLKITTLLRQTGIPTELYLEPVKLNKQLKYAHRRGIPFVVIIGPKEVKDKTIALKNMRTGEQKNISLTNLSELKANLNE
jgi:histidyl-tRNA synthetase